MTGVEIVVGCVAAWAWGKARRVAGRADTEVDAALDAVMDRVHEVVAEKLGPEPALAQLEIEAATDLEQLQVRERTVTRVELAVQDAIEADAEFAARVEQVVADLQAAEQATGHRPAAAQIVASGQGAIAIVENTGIASTGSGAVNVQRR